MIEREKLVSLVEKAQKGDNEALNELISECYNGFYYFALKSTGDEDKAAEVTQESCIEIISTIKNLREPVAFITWSQKIIYHQCMRHHKKLVEVQADEDEDGFTIFDRVSDEDSTTMPEEVYEDKEFQQTIQNLLNSLPPEQCSALMLYYYEKLSVKEIADIQGTNEGTIKSRLNYGRKAVKKKVEEYEKRTGTKLHAILPLPLLMFFLFKKGAEELPAIPAIPAIAGGTATAGAAASGAASAGAAASGAASAGVAASGAATAGVAALGASLVTKIVAGVIAAAAVIGTAVGIIAFKNNDDSDTDRPGHTQSDSSDTDTDDQTHEHSYVFTGEKDNNYHTLSCSCGLTEEQPHSYEDGLCLCGATNLPSEGLEYTLSEDERSYIVRSIGSCTDTDIIIPSTYNGLPVTSIGGYAFYLSDSLTSITIPDSVTSIGERAFEECQSLMSVTTGNGVMIIDEYAFYRCYSLTSITIPDGVTSIGYKAFSGCDITSITIPDSVTYIGFGAFASCDNLTNLTIGGGVTSMGKHAFEHCENLMSVTIGKGVTSISEAAFYSCESLTSITIPDSVTSIGEQAFAFCSSLTSLTIPDSVTSIGEAAFNGCSKSLESITVGNGNTKYHSSGNCLIETATKTLVLGSKNSIIPTDGSVTSIGDCAFHRCSLTSINIPNSVMRIGKYAFHDCDSLTSIIIPDSVTSFGYDAFSSCDNLTNVTIGDGVTTLSYNAFASCDNLTNVTIGDSVTRIIESAFEDCTSLTSIKYTGTKAQWEEIYKEDDWDSYTGNYTIHCVDGTITK